MNPFLATDGYKTGHMPMYPKGTTLVYGNFTPRSNKYANGIDKIVVFGTQMTMMVIDEMFMTHFFGRDKDAVCHEIKQEYSAYLGTDYDVSHIKALWDLGYLPIKVKSMPEGARVQPGIPVLTIYNTKPEFFWLTNFLETILSNLLWKPMTSASIAYEYKRNLLKWARKTDKENEAFVDYQGHDFSMRGLSGIDSVIQSGLGHATSFRGSDSLPVLHGANKYYMTSNSVNSVNATEHSVMSAGGREDEIETFRRLMKTFPTGVLSVVSDTWNLWDVLTKYLPTLKEEILARDGKLVIRPDSGDPVDIICGTIQSQMLEEEGDNTLEEEVQWRIKEYGEITYEEKGVIELLWDEFGGTINEQGYKVLDPHIGAIYGDSITLSRAEDICSRLERKGFASTNIVLGIGSFTYQYNTRDTFGFAMKATYVEIKSKKMDAHGKSIGHNIFKDPITDDGTKKSAKGLLKVIYNAEEDYFDLEDEVTWYDEDKGILHTIYEDGEFPNIVSLTEIRGRLRQ